MLTMRINNRYTTNSQGKRVIISDYRLSMNTDNPFELFAAYIKRANADGFARRYLPHVQGGRFLLNFE